MAENMTKQAIAKAKLEGEIIDLMIRTQVDNVFLTDGKTTLASQLADILTDLSLKANSTDVTEEINNAIAALIDGAPETYDTLKEIYEYIQTDKSAMEALNNAIANKVTKEEGKGLSANDFTNALKAKLDAIEDGAQVNQNAFSNVQVGETTITAADTTDIVKLIPGNNVVLTPNAEDKSIKIDVSATQVEVDDALSDTSENAVQNKVIKAAIDLKSTIHIQTEEPAEMKNNDIWLQIVE